MEGSKTAAHIMHQSSETKEVSMILGRSASEHVEEVIEVHAAVRMVGGHLRVTET